MKSITRGIPSLDGLRAISIFLVLISHVSVNVYHTSSASFSRAGSIIQTLLLVGHLGVNIFFVISGFLITTLLLKEDSINLGKFYFRRTLRIFPPYYFYLLVLFLFSKFGFLSISQSNFIAACTYTRNYFFDDLSPNAWHLAHTWSLAVEEQFYLIFPIILYLFGIRRGLAVAGSALIICPLLRFLYVLYNPEVSIEFIRFEMVADSLAFGCLLAGLRSTLHQRKWYKRLLQSNILVLAPFAALFITWWGHFPKYYNKGLYVLVFITIQNLLIALFLDWVVANSEGKIGSFLNARPIAYVGMISYSIYLWQQPLLDPALDLSMSIKLGLVLLASLGSYYLIEKPSLKFRNYLERGRSY